MPNQFIPRMTLFKDGHQGRFNLKGIKSIRFQIHIILAQICFRKSPVESSRFLCLHDFFFLPININKNPGNPAGRTIQTAYYFCRCPKPLVLIILHSHTILYLVFYLVRLILNCRLKLHHYSFFILWMQKI